MPLFLCICCWFVCIYVLEDWGDNRGILAKLCPSIGVSIVTTCYELDNNFSAE